MGTHDGHRDRLKSRFCEFGLETFNDINVLELLLFFSIPRRDTNEAAHRLLDQFGSLDGVFKASVYELTAVPGVGKNSAILITFIHQLIKKIEVSKTKDIKTISSSRQAAEYFIPRYINEEDEVLLMLCLDNARRIISCIEIAKGTVNAVEVNLKRIVELALKHKACSVIISHNHPGGTLRFSIEDDVFTREVFKALHQVSILLEDHIIVAEKQYFSFADSGVLRM